MSSRSFIRKSPTRETVAQWFISFSPSRSIVGLSAIVTNGWIRRHGVARSNGLQKYEACADSSNVATPMIKEAVERGDVVLAEVTLPNGVSIQIHTKPFVEREQVCVFLHQKYNDLWEEVWQSGKPVLLTFYMRR